MLGSRDEKTGDEETIENPPRDPPAAPPDPLPPPRPPANAGAASIEKNRTTPIILFIMRSS
jgi:hypothetical protein